MDLQHFRRSLVLLIDPTILSDLEELRLEIEYHERTVRGLIWKLHRIAPLIALSTREADYER